MHRPVRVLLAFVLLCGAASTASAQTEKGNVAVSYSILHDSELEETFPTGWLFAVTGNLNDIFAIVGEIGGNYKSIDVLGTDVNVRVHSFLGGIKFQNAASPKVVPFAQLLVGESVFNASALGEGGTDNAFSVQPGGGVDISVARNFAVRVQGDFRINRAEGETFNEFRVAFGGVFGFGRK